ncbi:MAG TPA: hypothetical protein VFS43_16845 [Polyangiaceae bacterium]|nr:hypothetical protein [Polyangiaceae bacterium]
MTLRPVARPAALAAALLAAGCGTPPPPSQFPSADAALGRMRATYACARGARGEAKLDRLSGQQGRLRGTVFFLAVSPERVRFDAVSPFGATVATLTSDGRDFSFLDLREKTFTRGPASACNLARLTQVPVPGHALVSLLRGEAPVLAHAPGAGTIRWDGGGYYVLDVPGNREARETLRLAPSPADFQKPWGEQRVRVLDVRVEQQGHELYHAELDGHAPASTAPPLVDEDGVEPPVPPSGPACTVEVPRRIHVTVASSDDDVLLSYKKVELNPPLPEGSFRQPVPGGVRQQTVGPCDH